MFISLLVTIVILYGLYLWIVARKYSHLPGYLGSEFPIIGNLYYSLKNSFLSHDDIQTLLQRLLPPGGGFCVLWMYLRPVLAISDPLLFEKLAEHPAFVDKEPLVYENNTNLWKGTFTYAYSDKIWKQRRKMINNSLKKKDLINYHTTFVKMSKRLADKMEHEKGPFNPGRYSMMTTLDSIIETHFGCDFKMIDNKEVYSLMHWGMGNVSKSFFNPVFGFIMNQFLMVYNILKPFDQVIEMSKKNASHKSNNDTEDVNKELYVEAIMKQYLSVDKKSKEMKQELVEMILVGSHTVGVLVKSTLVFLATLPEIQEKVWQEQHNIFGDSDRDPTAADVKNMDYLKRVLKEVLRFISGPAFVRRTRAEIDIDDVVIPPNTTVIVCSRLMRWNDHYWENPSKFDPDRYIGNNPSKSYKHSFSVFGVGIRNCPGVQYGYNETKTILSTVLRRFKLVSDKRFDEIKFSAQIMMEMSEVPNISVVKRRI